MAATASMPVAVIMQRRAPTHPWAEDSWSAVGVVPHAGTRHGVVTLNSSTERDTYLVPGLTLELYRDQHEGYFENCMAPEAKVFVMWRMQDGRAMPVHVSASYVEGTRMFDSGEPADGVMMPAEIHAWLIDYLARNYEPPVRKGRAAHG